jgi:UDP-3-O-[3-hydroxymyristoyl] glucosamine N-acyltransferase
MLINSNSLPVRIVGVGTMSVDLKEFLIDEKINAEIIKFENAVLDTDADAYQYLVVTIKSLELRKKILDWVDENNFHCPVYVHDRAFVQCADQLGPGTIVYPMASVLKSTVGRHVMIAPNCHVGHYAELDDRVLMLPGSMVLGTSIVAASTLIQTGATVKDNVKITAESVNILPRALVTRDIDVAGTYGGTPARRISSITSLTCDYFNQ